MSGSWSTVPASSAAGSSRTEVFDFQYLTAPAGATGANGAWSFTLPDWVTHFEPILIGPGGGGGGGTRATRDTYDIFGGNAGSNGTLVRSLERIPVAFLPNKTLNLSIGPAGVGGVLKTSGEGNAGTAGGDVQIASGGVTISKTKGGPGGKGGRTSAQSGNDAIATSECGIWTGRFEVVAGLAGNIGIAGPVTALTGDSMQGRSAGACGYLDSPDDTNYTSNVRAGTGMPWSAPGTIAGASGATQAQSLYGSGAASGTSGAIPGGNGGRGVGGAGGPSCSADNNNNGSGGNGGTGFVRLICHG